VRVLLARGAIVDARQRSGHTALDEARIRDDQRLIDLLVQAGASG
jgi:ankyrin repeat protein